MITISLQEKGIDASPPEEVLAGSLLDNYCPVANNNFLSKVIKRVVAACLNEAD